MNRLSLSHGRAALTRSLALTLATLLLVACGGGGGGTNGSTDGRLSIALTDAQGCSYQEVVVTIERVRIHRNANAAESEPGWQELVMNPPLRRDLLTLSNGVFADLGTLPLPAGDYSQVRLVLASNGSTAPYANQLRLSDGRVVALTTPSGAQSGLKLNAQIAVAPGQLAELVLDFDACRSVVKAGQSGRYLLKPVITAYAQAVSDIEGYTLPGARVSAQQGGIDLKNTVAAADGRFVLWPVVPGRYELVMTAPDHATAVLTGVEVGQGVTVVSTAATPLRPASSPMATTTGAVVLGAGAEIDARLRALQALEGGPSLEVASAAADAETGGYTFTLPTAAPGRAAWASGLTDYAFSAVTASAARYTLEARAAGFATPKTQDIDLSSGDLIAPDFVFP